jgi:hypothetical protein
LLGVTEKLARQSSVLEAHQQVNGTGPIEKPVPSLLTVGVAFFAKTSTPTTANPTINPLVQKASSNL